jgi:methylthioribose-1-phosphate isomerase
MAAKDFTYFSIRRQNGTLEVLDQRKLPDVEEWLVVKDPQDMAQYIKQLSVRGAPLIGVGAAQSLADYARAQKRTEDEIRATATLLRNARPTAVNLMFAIDKMIQVGQTTPDFSPEKLTEIAYDIMQKEVDMCDAMSKHGAALIKHGESILTHCNTGALATPGKGTALGVIREAHAQGKKIHVYVDETRPLLQGGRLTAYELQKEGIPYTVICDNMAATLMRDKKIDRVLVGADRIAINGDFANKIGTYTCAITAKFHNIPFHPVAPLSTVDFKCTSGVDIPIEERDRNEVLGASGSFGSVRWSPANSNAFNPAFDTTPVDLVSSLILDTGVCTQEEMKSGKLTSLEK